jgi:NADH-quinone oxidoreductase subunit H
VLAVDVDDRGHGRASVLVLVFLVVLVGDVDIVELGSALGADAFLLGLRQGAPRRHLGGDQLALGLGLLGVVLAAGSLKLDAIMNAQASSGVWYAFAQPLGFVVFLIASFAEAARLPFDLPEAEQELVGGYHTEYSGIKLLLFLVS